METSEFNVVDFLTQGLECDYQGRTPHSRARMWLPRYDSSLKGSDVTTKVGLLTQGLGCDYQGTTPHSRARMWLPRYDSSLKGSDVTTKVRLLTQGLECDYQGTTPPDARLTFWPMPFLLPPSQGRRSQNSPILGLWPQLCLHSSAST